MSKIAYSGPVQSTAAAVAVLEHVKKVGADDKLDMLPALKKPFGGDAIIKIVQELSSDFADRCRQRQSRRCHYEEMDRVLVRAGHRPAQKCLVGAETYAGIRHPEAGIILPGGFIAGGSPACIYQLSEMAVISALKAGSTYAKLASVCRSTSTFRSKS